MSASELKPRKTRSKTGCLCCRLRKKKCDEAKPTCVNCERIGLLCSWPTSKEFAWRQKMGLSQDDSSDDGSPQSSNTRVVLAHLQSQRHRQSQGEASNSRQHANHHIAFRVILGRLTIPQALQQNAIPDNVSWQLMQLWVESSCPELLSLPPAYTEVFTQDVLAWAFTDSLVLNAVLAVGGYPTYSQNHTATYGGLKARSLQHQLRTVKELKIALTEWDNGINTNALRLLLVTVLLRQYESIQGVGTNTQSQHYRASQHFAKAILDDRRRYNCRIAGLLLEFQAYAEFCTMMQFRPDAEDIDTARAACILRLPELSDYETFGLLFGATYKLCGVIPHVVKLSLRRQTEIAESRDLGCRKDFEELQSTIWRWNFDCTTQHADINGVANPNIVNGALVQHAMLLFLYAGYYDSPAKLKEASGPIVQGSISLMPHMRRDMWFNSFWPMIVIGAFATTIEMQTSIRQHLPPLLPITRWPLKFLEWIWQNKDVWYGVDALTRVCHMHRLGLDGLASA